MSIMIRTLKVTGSDTVYSKKVQNDYIGLVYINNNGDIDLP